MTESKYHRFDADADTQRIRFWDASGMFWPYSYEEAEELAHQLESALTQLRPPAPAYPGATPAEVAQREGRMDGMAEQLDIHKDALANHMDAINNMARRLSITEASIEQIEQLHDGNLHQLTEAETDIRQLHAILDSHVTRITDLEEANTRMETVISDKLDIVSNTLKRIRP